MNQFSHINVITLIVKSFTVSPAVALHPLEIPRGKLSYGKFRMEKRRHI